MKIKQLAIVIACVLAIPSAALAQPAASATTCAPTQAKPDDPTGLNTAGRNDKPLTDKLAESGGVLCPPPAVDSDIRVPTPESGSNMPVVPPPGSPGGDPTVRPK